MPYTIEDTNGEWCVYKSQDGQPTGEALGCHDKLIDAQEHAGALYAAESGKALSLDERDWFIRFAFYEFVHEAEMYPDVIAVYDDYLIAQVYETERGFYRVPFEAEGTGYEFAQRADWQPVEREWIDRKALESPDQMVYFGGAVKALGDGRVGGYLVRYGDAKQTDLQGEYFDPGTDFVVSWDGAVKSDVYYQHGLDPAIGRAVLGQGDLKRDEVGVWIEAQLEMRNAYESAVYDMATRGELGWSSGSAGHLIERESDGKATRIKRWPLGIDASLTPAPAEWRNEAIPLKSLTASPIVATVKATAETDPETPDPEAQTSAGGVASKAAATIVSVSSQKEGLTMPDNVNPTPEQNDDPGEDRLTGLEATMKTMGDTLGKLMDYIESAPAGVKAGYVSADGGAADPEVKNLGDFCKAVMRGDVTRLTEVYGSKKDLVTTDGSAGGFTVPSEFSTVLLERAQIVSPILSRVRSVPVSGGSGKWPALDNYVTPTAGSGETAKAAGAKGTARAEGATATETEPKFIQLEWRVKNVSGYTEVSMELRDESPMAIEMLLSDIFAIVIAAKQEQMILRGDGVTEYLGILNSPAAIGIAPDTDNLFAYADMLEIISRFKAPLGMGNAAWLCHMGLIPDIGQFEIGTAGAAVPTGVGTGAAVATMPGTNIPIIYSEHLPQDDNSGCAILADLNAYIIWQRGALSIEYSEHAEFKSFLDTWRFNNRSDGMPQVKNVITLADPQGSYTLSPFVYLDD